MSENSPAVQAAINAAVAQEQRFGSIEQQLALQREQYKQLAETLARIETNEIQFREEVRGHFEHINGSVGEAIAAVGKVESNQLQHFAFHREPGGLDERVRKLWGASLDGKAIRGVLMGQWKALSIGAGSGGALFALLQQLHII